jgi:membrane protein YqaA with SNARE-associated domain
LEASRSVPGSELEKTLDGRNEATFSVLRLCGGFVVLFLLLTVAGWAFRDPLSTFGEWFVERFGMGGIVFGSFLADGFHFPVPPQFYMWTGIAGGQGEAPVIASVLVGSELGGLAAFVLARMAGRSRFLDARIGGARKLLTKYVERLGYRGLVVAALLPVSYCLLCMAAGAMRLPYRAYAVLAAMRVPRIILSYAIIIVAWGAT